MNAHTLGHQEDKIEVMPVQGLIHILSGQYFANAKYSKAIKLIDLWWEDRPNGDVLHTFNVM
jgi:hypothetical protein